MKTNLQIGNSRKWNILSYSDHKKQRQNYCDLVGRIVTDSLPCLSELKDVAVKHIPHQYSKEMKEATDTVSENQL